MLLRNCFEFSIMNKNQKDINETSEKSGTPSILKALTNKYFLATVVFLILITFVAQNNIVRWIKASEELKQQEQLIDHYTSEIEKVDQQIDNLSSNRDSLEKFAREKYYYQNSDEEVFLVGDGGKVLK